MADPPFHRHKHRGFLGELFDQSVTGAGAVVDALYPRDIETLLVLGIVLVMLVVLGGAAMPLVLFAWLRHLWRGERRTPAVTHIAQRAATAGQVIAIPTC